MSSASERRKNSGGGGDEGGGANWMDTYGDLVTLLLTFFVLLFSFSTIDAEKWKALVGSFTGVTVIGVEPLSPEIAIEEPIPKIGPPILQLRIDEDIDAEEANISEDSSDIEDTALNNTISNLHEIYETLSGYIVIGGIDADIEMIEDEHIIRVIIPDLVFFETGSAVVRPEAYPILDTVIEMFHKVDHMYSMLRVEGHTDSRPINTAQYPSNWHVSVFRAVNVVEYIREDGRLDTTRLVALGYGEEHPVAPNDTPENMALNRRVEFVVEASSQREENAGLRLLSRNQNSELRTR